MKQSQVTLFMILGLVVIILILLFIFLNYQQKSARTETRQAQRIALDVGPIETYITECLRDTTQEAFKLLGKQGGYIYRQQGGQKRLPDARLHISDDPYFIPHRILAPDSAGRCRPYPNQYPVSDQGYPFTSTLFNDKQYRVEFCFGDFIPLDVNKSLQDVASYVSSNLFDECDLSLFTNVEITTIDPQVEIVDRSVQTQLSAEFPLTIVDKTSKAQATVQSLQITIDFSLDPVYAFVSERILNDIADPTYVITTQLPQERVVVTNTNLANGDDIVRFQMQRYPLAGQPFEFQFARKNRPPVLEHVHETSFPTAITQGQTLEYTNSSLVAQELQWVDPDEDQVETQLWVQGWSPEMIKPQEEYRVTNEDANKGYLLINITATDGFLTDYQTSDHNNNEYRINVQRP